MFSRPGGGSVYNIIISTFFLNIEILKYLSRIVKNTFGPQVLDGALDFGLFDGIWTGGIFGYRGLRGGRFPTLSYPRRNKGIARIEALKPPGLARCLGTACRLMIDHFE